MKSGERLGAVFAGVRVPPPHVIEWDERRKSPEVPAQIPLYAPQPHAPEVEREQDHGPQAPADDWRYNY